MEANAKIYVAGHNGLAGSALVKKLKSLGYGNIITRTHAELDLTRQEAVESFFAKEKPEFVILGPPRWGALWPIIPIRRNLSATIWPSKQMSSIQPGRIMLSD